MLTQSIKILTLTLICISCFADTVENDTCAGPTALLSIVNRPTAADSPCVLPDKKIDIELGYQYQRLIEPLGDLQNFPQAQLRLGLLSNNEVTVLLPIFINTPLLHYYGNTTTGVGLKHKLGSTKEWIATVESILVLPGGSNAFGSKGLGAAFNGIVSYSFSPTWSVSFMFGGTTLTSSRLAGGGRTVSLNPDLVLTYFPIQTLAVYGEVYGQSKTAPGLGSGANYDAGLIYLLLPTVTLDLEYGQQLNGFLGGFERYVGAGMAVML